MAIFGALFFVQLGCSVLVNPDEGRYAEIPREMVATGDWVTPRLNGVQYFEKPPLMYWAVAVCLKVFGPSEWSMRAAPALFALGGVLLTYAAGRRLGGPKDGFAAAVVLGTSLLYFGMGRILILDMAVSVLMSATLVCFILGVREAPGAARRWFFYGLYASAALATLTKGLIGFLLTGLVMFTWLLVFNQWKRLRPLYLPSGVALFLAIAVPWHVLAAMRNPGWAHFYFVREHWERFTTTEHGRAGPWWYFLPVIVGGLFPWTGFLWRAVRERLRGGWAARKENADQWFLVVWAVVIWAFFSKSQSKLIPYIVPVFPALALLIAPTLTSAIATANRAALRVGVWVFSVVALLLGAAMLVVVYRESVLDNAPLVAMLRDNAIVSALSLAAGAVAAPWLLARGRVRGALIALVASTGGMFLALDHAQDEIARPGTVEFARKVKAEAQPGDLVYHYRDFFHDFVFYGERMVGVVGYYGELEVEWETSPEVKSRFIDEAEFRRQWEGPVRIWVVARKRAVKELFGDPTFRYHLLGEGRGHYLFSNRP